MSIELSRDMVRALCFVVGHQFGGSTKSIQCYWSIEQVGLFFTELWLIDTVEKLIKCLSPFLMNISTDFY